MTDDRPAWHPETYRDRRAFLHQRHALMQSVRGFFLDHGFLEVECPQIQKSPGNEVHLHALEVFPTTPEGDSLVRYLSTSPEFSCKKILAAGEDKIFTFARVFRDRESGPLHALEFTLLEWYRANTPYQQGMEDVLSLLKRAGERAEQKCLSYHGVSCNPFLDADHLTVSEAFLRYAGVDLLATIDSDGKPSFEALSHQAACQSFLSPPLLSVSEGEQEKSLRRTQEEREKEEWSDLFSKILGVCVEPHLGRGRPTVLDQYPSVLSALARPCPDDPRVSERFEVYACGVELANGFGELTDPELQRTRLEAEMLERKQRYGTPYPLDEDFLAALAFMPPSVGVALGFDRLALLMSHGRTLQDVMWMPNG